MRMQLIDHLDLEFGEFANCIRIHLLLLSHFSHDPQSHISFQFYFFWQCNLFGPLPAIFFFFFAKTNS